MDIDAGASTPIPEASGGVASLGHLRYELTALAVSKGSKSIRSSSAT